MRERDGISVIMASQLLVSYRYQEHFPLHLLFLTSLPDGFIFQNVLRVTCGESEHALSFATPEDRQAALTLVQSALDDLLASQPALREARDRARAALEGTSTPAAVSASVSATPASSGPTPAQPAPQVPAPAPVSVSASAPAASPLTTSGSADATKPGPPPGLSAREKRDTLSLGSGNVLRKAQTQTAPSAEADVRTCSRLLAFACPPILHLLTQRRTGCSGQSCAGRPACPRWTSSASRRCIASPWPSAAPSSRTVFLASCNCFSCLSKWTAPV